MRTEEAERAIQKLADVYVSLRNLHLSTRDNRYLHQAEGIDLAVKALGLGAEEFMQLTLPTFPNVEGDQLKWR